MVRFIEMIKSGLAACRACSQGIKYSVPRISPEIRIPGVLDKFIRTPLILISRNPVAAIFAVCLCLGSLGTRAADTKNLNDQPVFFKDCSDCPEMAVIDAGQFTMGTSLDEIEVLSRDWEGNRLLQNIKKFIVTNETPPHRERIAKQFAVSRHEITRKLFFQFLAETKYEEDVLNLRGPKESCFRESVYFDGSEGLMVAYGAPFSPWRNPGFEQEDDHPVVCVSWEDVEEFTSWLSRKTGKQYRIPTEIEWEYFARAGRKESRSLQESWKTKLACEFENVIDQSRYDSFEKPPPKELYFECSDGFVNTAPVGSKRPNEFGLYDVLGNVAEWVKDCPYRYDGSPFPLIPGLVNHRCVYSLARGGAWSRPYIVAREAHRTINFRFRGQNWLGFRVVRAYP